MPLGKVFTPCRVERFGRLGRAAENLLARLHDASSNRSELRGGHASRAVERVRARIDAIVHRHAARVCNQAEHDVHGVAPCRAAPSTAQASIEGDTPGIVK